MRPYVLLTKLMCCLLVSKLPTPQGGPSIVVHPARLRTWAKDAHDAAKNLAHGQSTARAAKDLVGGAGPGLRSTQAGANASDALAWQLDGLLTALDSYGENLTIAAIAYENHDYAAANVFVPQEIRES